MEVFEHEFIILQVSQRSGRMFIFYADSTFGGALILSTLHHSVPPNFELELQCFSWPNPKLVSE